MYLTVYPSQGTGISMSDTLAANQYATYPEWDHAMDEHNREASGILHQLLGALEHKTCADEQVKARTLDHYAAKVREWDANRPEWVR